MADKDVKITISAKTQQFTLGVNSAKAKLDNLSKTATQSKLAFQQSQLELNKMSLALKNTTNP